MNYFKEVLDIDKCKELIAQTPEDEICILCPHYSINIQSKYNNDDTVDPEQMDYDFTELEDELGYQLSVNDYDDLICDPHNILI